MLHRTLRSSTASRVSNLFRLNCVNKFSDNVEKEVSVAHDTEQSHNNEKDSLSSTPSNAEDVSRLLRDAATFSDAHDKSWATTPFPRGAPSSLEGEISKKQMVDPTKTNVIVFPGQGTLKVGSVQKYLRYGEAKELFEIANEILGYDLLKICLEGPQDKLNKTYYNQPATVVASLAALERLREDRPQVLEHCVATAGYSVGELTSLIFSGAISYEAGIRLVAVRGSAMQYAASLVPQGMISVYCSPVAKVSKLCQNAEAWARDLGIQDPVCKVAIYLYTQGKILAGNKEALQYLETNGHKSGLKKLRSLPVSGAFHTRLMEPAVKPFKKMLSTIDISPPVIDVYSNCSGLPHKQPDIWRRYLVKQMVSPVKWEQIMQELYKRPEGVAFPRTFDVGSEGRMKTILKLINAKAWDSCIAV